MKKTASVIVFVLSLCTILTACEIKKDNNVNTNPDTTNLNSNMDTSNVNFEDSLIPLDEFEVKEAEDISDNAKEIKDLLNLSKLNPEKTPVMYDFVYSAPGYKTVNYEFPYANYYFLCKKPNEDTVFIEQYVCVGGDYEPLLGTAPIKYEIEDTGKFYLYVKNIDKKYIIEENEWQFIILPENYEDENSFDGTYYGVWGGINFYEVVSNTEYGLMQKEIYEENKGWPMEWLRRDSDIIQERYINYMINGGNSNPDLMNLNFDSEFWDKYPYGKNIRLKTINTETGEEAYGLVYPLADGIFAFYFQDRSNYLYEKQYLEMIESDTWELIEE